MISVLLANFEVNQITDKNKNIGFNIGHILSQLYMIGYILQNISYVMGVTVVSGS